MNMRKILFFLCRSCVCHFSIHINLAQQIAPLRFSFHFLVLNSWGVFFYVTLLCPLWHSLCYGYHHHRTLWSLYAFYVQIYHAYWEGSSTTTKATDDVTMTEFDFFSVLFSMRQYRYIAQIDLARGYNIFVTLGVFLYFFFAHAEHLRFSSRESQYGRRHTVTSVERNLCRSKCFRGKSFKCVGQSCKN